LLDDVSRSEVIVLGSLSASALDHSHHLLALEPLQPLVAQTVRAGIQTQLRLVLCQVEVGVVPFLVRIQTCLLLPCPLVKGIVFQLTSILFYLRFVRLRKLEL